MTLEVYLILFKPADVELLARGATLELPGDVLFVIADDPMGYTSQRQGSTTIE